MSSLRTPQAVRTLGEFIREQRASAQISLRQLAKQAGISNPYLSQIERGLRKPSAEILQQIAKALRISAETLYVHAGILDRQPTDGLGVDEEDGKPFAEVTRAVLDDPALTERQKQVLLEIYHAFRRENQALGVDAGAGASTLTVEAEVIHPAAANEVDDDGLEPGRGSGEVVAG